MSTITGAEIKAARERRGMTQQELADHLGKTRSLISMWETGDRFGCCKFCRREVARVLKLRSKAGKKWGEK